MYIQAHKIYETAKALQLEVSAKVDNKRTFKIWVPKSLAKNYDKYSNVEMYEVLDSFADKKLVGVQAVDQYNRKI